VYGVRTPKWYNLVRNACNIMGSRELRHTSADLDYRYAFGDLLVVRDAPLALENYRF
jgi:hypothetical protein